jgi:hypothetical protein
MGPDPQRLATVWHHDAAFAARVGLARQTSSSSAALAAAGSRLVSVSSIGLSVPSGCT